MHVKAAQLLTGALATHLLNLLAMEHICQSAYAAAKLATMHAGEA